MAHMQEENDIYKIKVLFSTGPKRNIFIYGVLRSSPRSFPFLSRQVSQKNMSVFFSYGAGDIPDSSVPFRYCLQIDNIQSKQRKSIENVREKTNMTNPKVT